MAVPWCRQACDELRELLGRAENRLGQRYYEEIARSSQLSRAGRMRRGRAAVWGHRQELVWRQVSRQMNCLRGRWSMYIPGYEQG